MNSVVRISRKTFNNVIETGTPVKFSPSADPFVFHYDYRIWDDETTPMIQSRTFDNFLRIPVELLCHPWKIEECDGDLVDSVPEDTPLFPPLTGVTESVEVGEGIKIPDCVEKGKTPEDDRPLKKRKYTRMHIPPVKRLKRGEKNEGRGYYCKICCYSNHPKVIDMYDIAKHCGSARHMERLAQLPEKDKFHETNKVICKGELKQHHITGLNDYPVVIIE